MDESSGKKVRGEEIHLFSYVGNLGC